MLWAQTVKDTLARNGFSTTINKRFIHFEGFSLKIFLADGSCSMEDITQATDRKDQVIVLWPDQWQFRREQVLSRILSLTGRNERIHGRACRIVQVDQPAATAFLNANHLQGAVKAKYRIGLTHKDKLVALALFAIRPMPKKGIAYRSAELIRFCSLTGYTVVGGLSKLMDAFAEQEHPDDMMTYADKDWSDGDGYYKLGFELIGETAPLYFWLIADKRYTFERLPSAIRAQYSTSEALSEAGFTEIFNSGNYKFIKRYEN